MRYQDFRDLILEETNPETITTLFKDPVKISIWYFGTVAITGLADYKYTGPYS